MIKVLLKKIRRFILDDSRSEEQIHAYWKNPDDGFNKPIGYTKVNKRSEFLVDKIRPFEKEIRILELGCNAGRNLNYLYQAGYKNLTGVEISQNAINQMQQSYSDLFNNITLFVESIENFLNESDEKNYDLIFTMAVLEHIHKNSEWIFKKMVDRTNKYIMTIEDERSISWKHFPRNYYRVFKELGMKQVDYFDCSVIEGLHKGFYYRLFEKAN